MAIFLLSILSMLVVPIFEKRSSVFAFFVLMFLVLRVLKDSGRVKNFFFFSLLIVTVLLGVYRATHFSIINDGVSENIKVLKESRGREIVELKRHCLSYQVSGMICYDVDEHPTYINQGLAHYYQVDSVVLKPEESVKKNWERIKREIEAEGVSKFTMADNNLWIKKESDRLHVLIDLGKEDISQDLTTILRGARRGSIRHKLLTVLPKSIRIYFLDFLEYTGTYYRDGSSVLYTSANGNVYAYHLVFNSSAYDHFLWSQYSLDNHTATGEIFKIGNEHTE